MRASMLYVRVLVWRSWLFARAEKCFSARANSQLRLTRVLHVYVIDEGRYDESR